MSSEMNQANHPVPPAIYRILWALKASIWVWMCVIPLMLTLGWIFVESLPREWILDLVKTKSIAFAWYTPWLGLVCAAPSLILHILLFRQVLNFIHLLELGQVFTESTLICLKNISLWYLLKTFISLLTANLAVTVLTLANPPGQTMMSFGVSSHDLERLATAGFLTIMIWVMNQAVELKSESELTV